MKKVDREQILAYRIAQHGLNQRVPLKSLLKTSASGFQNFTPGSVLLALGARVEGMTKSYLEDLLFKKRSLVNILGIRGADFIVPSKDLWVFTMGVRPMEVSDLEAVLKSVSADFKKKKVSPIDVICAAGEVARKVLNKTALSQDEIHAKWRKELPKAYLYPCKGCGTHHLHPLIVSVLGQVPEFCFGPERNGETLFVRPDQWLKVKPFKSRAEYDKIQLKSQKELVQRYLKFYGPSTHPEFAAWAGVSLRQAAEVWHRIESDLVEIQRVGEKKPRFLLKKDTKQFDSSPRPESVRFLPPKDPYLDQRDRSTLVPSPASQKKIWKILGNPGVILLDGEIVATWRAQKKSRNIEIQVEPFQKLSLQMKKRVDAEAERVAFLKDVEGAVVRYTTPR